MDRFNECGVAEWGAKVQKNQNFAPFYKFLIRYAPERDSARAGKLCVHSCSRHVFHNIVLNHAKLSRLGRTGTVI